MHNIRTLRQAMHAGLWHTMPLEQGWRHIPGVIWTKGHVEPSLPDLSPSARQHARGNQAADLGEAMRADVLPAVAKSPDHLVRLALATVPAAQAVWKVWPRLRQLGAHLRGCRPRLGLLVHSGAALTSGAVGLPGARPSRWRRRGSTRLPTRTSARSSRASAPSSAGACSRKQVSRRPDWWWTSSPRACP